MRNREKLQVKPRLLPEVLYDSNCYDRDLSRIWTCLASSKGAGLDLLRLKGPLDGLEHSMEIQKRPSFWR